MIVLIANLVVLSAIPDGFVGQFPGLQIDDRFVGPWVEVAVVADEPLVDRVVHNGLHCVLVEALAAYLFAGAVSSDNNARFGAVALAVGLVGYRAWRMGLDQTPKNEPYDLRLAFVGSELLSLPQVVKADGYITSVPQPSFGPARHLAQSSLPGELSLELGEAEEDVEHEHAGRV
ncbi:MAG: hypothetical protein Q7R32_12050 [Dehalococcoidia bacterium]|nr:hypothetical protein [Dehalococcoidia bacterium]